MIPPIPFTRLASIALVSFVIAACGGQKEPAQQALADLNGALAKVGEMSEKYMPEEFAEVKAQLDGLQKSFDGGDYDAVVRAAPAASAAIRQLQADSIIAKAEYAQQMNAEWAELAGTMPDTITAVDRQISKMGAGGRLPKGMDQAGFKQTVTSFDEAKKAWAAAAEAGNAGNYEDAVLQSREIRKTVETVMQSLGMAAG